MPKIELKNEMSNNKFQTNKKYSLELTRIGTATKLSRLQKSIISENKEITAKYLKPIMDHIPVNEIIFFFNHKNQ